MQKDLNKKINNAAKWSTLAELCAKLIAPITNAVLARLLVPEAFGVVATLTLVVSFAEIFTDAGFQKYLVQHQFSDDEDLEVSTNVAFWTNLAFSCLLWGGIGIFATPITKLVGSPGCETAVIVMSAQIPLLAFSSIQTARYRRAFDFKSLFYARIATALVPLIVTVPLALVFRSYWALVIGTLAKDVLNAVILTAKSKWKPRFCYRIEKLKEMLSFSLWTIVENVTIWLSLNADIFIVGLVLDSFSLGLYKTSISTVNSLMNLITGATMPVLFASLSRCQEDDGAFKEVFYKFQRMVSLLVLPLGFGMFVYRELATTILLGDQWLETADFLGMWALTGALNIVFHNFNSEAFRSRGKPKLSVLTQVLHIVVLIPVIMIFMRYGYKPLTIARSLVRLEMIVVSSIVAYVTLRLSLSRSLRNVMPQLISSLVMAAAGMWLRSFCDHILYEIATVVVCCVIYAGCMLIIPEGRRQLKEIPMLRKLFRR